MHLSLLLDMAAGAMGERRAVTAPDGELTYAELRRAAHALAAEIGPGSRAVFLGVNGAAVPVALFGASIAGSAFTPLNYRLTDPELARIGVRAAPAFTVADDDMAARLAGIDGLELSATSAVVARSVEAGATPGPADEGVAVVFDPEDVAVMLFTSGTTGEPKAALLRHRHLASYVMATLEFGAADESEAALVSVPPYHIAGIAAATSSLYVGRRVVYLPAFTPEAWVETAAREAITHAMVVPTMLGRVLDVLEASGERLPALRHLSYGGGRMPVAVIERALTWLPEVNFVNAYGLTETSSTISVLAPEDHREANASDDPAVRARLGSVGRPHGAIEVSIRDPFGEEVAAGEQGEIWVRGEQVSGEYVGLTRTREDGWFPTNDAGRLDDAGFLFVEGRLDDVIVRGGENISPGEIEDVLRTHPDIVDVAVFGVPSEEWGEEVGAAVVLTDGSTTTPDDLRAFVRERLRSTKAPTHLDVRAELPYNDTGKLLRRVLRAEASASGD